MRYERMRRRLVCREFKAFKHLKSCPKSLHNMNNVEFTDLVGPELAVLEPKLRLVSS